MDNKYWNNLKYRKIPPSPQLQCCFSQFKLLACLGKLGNAFHNIVDGGRGGFQVKFVIFKRKLGCSKIYVHDCLRKSFFVHSTSQHMQHLYLTGGPYLP